MDFFDRRRRQPARLRDRELPVLDFPLAPANSTAPSRWGPYGRSLYDLFVHITDDDGGSGANKQRKRVPASSLPRSIITAGRVLDAPGLKDGDHLNLLDWSPSRDLAVALDDVVHSFNPATSAHEIVFDYMGSPISSLSWAPDGRHLAVGTYDSLIYIWDVERKCPTRTLKNVHRTSSRVGSLAWKCDSILTSGGSDGKVVSSDPRMPSAAHAVQSHRGHGPGDICGLKWSPDHASFKQLASGGSDGLVHVWDARNHNQWAFRFKVAARDAPVRALDWYPFKGCLLSTGGGAGGDGGSIRLWSTQTGASVGCVKTGSTRVCALLWSKTSKQLLSCGTDQNHMTIWDYPSCVKAGELVGHAARVPYVALSPDGTTVASASGGDDSTLRLWNIFPPVPKPTSRAPFSGSYHAHIRSNGSIRLWSTQTGACVRSVKTGSTRVCALMWSKTTDQLLSSCSGTGPNHMTLWDYPSYVKSAELEGHIAWVPYIVLSPDGTTVALASGGIDSTLRLWNIFPPLPKPTSRAPFSGLYHAHIRAKQVLPTAINMWLKALSYPTASEEYVTPEYPRPCLDPTMSEGRVAEIVWGYVEKRIVDGKWISLLKYFASIWFLCD